MSIQRLWVSGCLLLGLTWGLVAQERFQGEQALKYIQKLCTPEFEARKTGLPGGRKAAEWIASQWQSWGLQPGSERGTFLQEYPMIVSHQSKPARLILKNSFFGEIQYQENNDFTVFFNSGSGKVTGKVVFAGYGISAPAKGWDDFKDTDVRGKIMLIQRETPPDGQDWSAENERDYKLQMAIQHGAIGLLIFSRDEWAIRGGTIHEAGYNPNLPAFHISRKIAHDIFLGCGRSLDNTLENLTKRPQSFPLGKQMTLQVQVKRLEPGVGENVVGLLPGQDATLRHEYIVIGGHIDHCGVSAQGHNYVGADDNASGTAVVMELARIFTAQRQRLNRSVLFVGFGGEEQGLRGSQYFAANPPVPAEQICLMFNFDMEGMGNGGGGFGGRNYFPTVIHEMEQGLTDSVRNKFGIYRAWGMGGSDHAHFIEQGIPTFGFFSTGPHPFYHQIEDTPDKINVQSLQFVGDRAAGLLEKFGNLPGSLLYANQRTGHCFVRFGDQIDFEPEFQTSDIFKQDVKVWVLNYAERSIRGVVLPLTDAANSPDTPLELYRKLDAFSQWIKTNNTFLLPFQNGSSLSQAANAGKLAVAIGSNGTAGIGSDLTCWRNFFKLGLNFLQLRDTSDPFFAGDSLSAFGKSLLAICQEEQVCLDWTLPDTTRLLKTLRDYRGAVIVRWEFPLAAHLSPVMRKWFDNPRRLLSAACQPQTSPAELSQLIDALPPSRLHLTFSEFPPVSSESAASGKSDLPTPEQQIQAWYQYRIQQHTKNEVYREMVNLLGDNLKKLGEITSGRR